MMHCGAETIHWEFFATALSVLMAAMNTIGITISNVDDFERAWRVVDIRATFRVSPYCYFMSPYNEIAFFMRILRNKKCMDDRDRIYALLGLGFFHLRRT